jgi:glycosyltransferase involved in cell wall biosynthesis
MTTPAVTIAIPFHDEERHLEGAIRSVLRQTFGDFELLLVDDGSGDRSLEIARSFHDARITVDSDGARRGLPTRLNQIIDRARAELIARMDADDVSHPTRLARQVERLRERPELDVLGTWIGLVDDDRTLIGVGESCELPASPATVLARGLLAHPTIVARRAWYRGNRYDETLTRAEDRDLWVRTVATSCFGVIAEPLYVLRIKMNEAGFVRDYTESQRQNRIIYRRHGVKTVGWRRTVALYGASLAKSGVMRTANALGVQSLIVRRRGRPATGPEKRLIDEALASGAQRP